MNKKEYLAPLFLLALLLGLCGYFYDNQAISSVPKGHHSWAMSDYYAMAVRYSQDEWNLFRVKTFNLETEDGITASDLPLASWLSGGLMRLLGQDTPVVYRLLTLLVSLLGSVFFFRLLFESGISRWRSVVVAVLFWMLPCAMFYHHGFLPSVWAFNTLIIGLWALQRAQRESSYWLLSIALFTLAALLRKPQVLFLGTLVLFADNRAKRLIWLAGVGVFSLWQLYDWWLIERYGSIFLRQFLPPASLGQAVDLAVEIWKKWSGRWFSAPHLIWFGAAILGLLRFRKQLSSNPLQTRLFFAFAGVACLYFILMMRQFVDHDYYAFDSFYPLTFVGVWWAAKGLDRLKYAVFFESALLILAIPIAQSTLRWYQRSEAFTLSDKTIDVYAGARPLLDKLGVAPDARILVFEAFSTNAPLCGMGRRGYTLLSSRPEAQEKGLSRQPDYAVCLDTNFVSEVVNDYPEVVKKLSFVGRNADLWVFKTGQFPENTLENLLASSATVLRDTSLVTQEEFLMSVTMPPASGKKIVLSGKIGAEKGATLKPTIALFKDGALAAYIETKITVADTGFRCVDLNVPNVPADEMRVYLWNPDRARVTLDHFRLSALELKNLTE